MGSKGKTRPRYQANAYAGELPLAAMPVATAPIGLVAGQLAKESAPDPVFEEGRKLRNEAERALRRYMLHEATRDNTSGMVAAAKAIEQLRGW